VLIGILHKICELLTKTQHSKGIIIKSKQYPDRLVTEEILGYEIVIADTDRCVETICNWNNGGDRARFFVCANPHSLVLAEKDPVFKTAIQSADLITPDGAGIVLASKILGGDIKTRVTGSDVFTGLSRKLNDQRHRKFSYFFLGSTEMTLSAIKDRMKMDFPGIRIAGTYSPPFKETFSEEDSRKIVEVVNQSAPDVLWVGMTAPKQEKWVFQHRDELHVKFIGAIGAVFDFYAGSVKRSPPVFQRLGLEWLPRLIRDPRRLHRRMLVSAPRFMVAVLKQRFF